MAKNFKALPSEKESKASTMVKSGYSVKAIPHRDCAEDALSDFSSDCAEVSQAYCRMSRNFCARSRKICKQIRCKTVRRSLCGVALNILQEYISQSYITLMLLSGLSVILIANRKTKIEGTQFVWTIMGLVFVLTSCEYLEYWCVKTIMLSA